MLRVKDENSEHFFLKFHKGAWSARLARNIAQMAPNRAPVAHNIRHRASGTRWRVVPLACCALK